MNPNAVNEANILDAYFKQHGTLLPLHCVTAILKDVMNVAGLPTTCGVNFFKPNIASEDADTVSPYTLDEFLICVISFPLNNLFIRGEVLRPELSRISHFGKYWTWKEKFTQTGANDVTQCTLPIAE